MELDLKKAENRLARFGLHPYVQTHATGHPNYAEIRDAVRAVQPKALIPVHSQHPELFQNLHDNVIILEIGQEIVLAP